MKRLFILSCFVFLGLVAWRIGARLSPDAIGMALGLLFGVLAGIPTAVLVLSSRRREERDGVGSARERNTRLPWQGYPGQAPVIILAAPGFAQGNVSAYGAEASNGHMRALPGPHVPVDVRDFRVVGEDDEAIEEW